ncbi:MAG: RNA polymerase sigma factor [Thermodesulfobacteriota bacterium]
MTDNSSTENTGELVRSFRSGDIQAFNRLVLIYQNRIYNLALNYVKNPEEAKDLTQDIFVNVYLAIHSLREDNKFSAWLYRIAVNKCRNHYNRLNRRGFFLNKSLDDENTGIQLKGEKGPELALEKEDLTNQVRTGINSLKKNERDILVLRDLQGLSYEEISTILKMPLGTVKSKLNRARAALKKQLKSIYKEL